MGFNAGLTLLYQTSSATLLTQDRTRLTISGGDGLRSGSLQVTSSASLATDSTSTLVSLDSETVQAIGASLAPLDNGRPGYAQAITGPVLGELSQKLSQGNGAYIVTFITPGGSLTGAFSQVELATYEAGGVEPIGGYSIGDAIKAALSNGWSQAGAAPAVPANGKLANAERALAFLDKGLGQTPLPVRSVTDDEDDTTTTLVAGASDVDGRTGVSISLVYIPPSDATTVQTITSAAKAQSFTLNSVA